MYTLDKLKDGLSDSLREEIKDGNYIPIPKSMFAHIIHDIRSSRDPSRGVAVDMEDMERQALLRVGILLLLCEESRTGGNAISSLTNESLVIH